MAQDRQPTHLAWDEGRSFRLAGDLLTFKVTGAETMGAYAAAEVTVWPGGGPPPHIHHREDEAFYILEGEFEFLAGDRAVRATTGGFVHGPKGIPHTFKNVGATPGRMLVIASPAGFEEFVREAGEPTTDRATQPPGPGPAEIERLMHVSPKYGIELVGPPPGG
jgi:mannose-6-phosphate isomerase-like protein (cupin superfamily)